MKTNGFISGKICTSLTQKNCVIFDGDLVIGSSITAADIQKLETVNGKLTINGTTLPSLEFPALTTITSSTGTVTYRNPLELTTFSPGPRRRQ